MSDGREITRAAFDLGKTVARLDHERLIRLQRDETLAAVLSPRTARLPGS